MLGASDIRYLRRKGGFSWKTEILHGGREGKFFIFFCTFDHQKNRA